MPIAFKSYMSSAKMRVLKPEIDEINAKYPKQEDAMKKQQAIMDLYKKAGASPTSGCLPMLLQFPILIGQFLNTENKVANEILKGLNLEINAGEVHVIMGPNGSGKSNVVDAVRWVLGEQSVKSLRGDGSMSDVIFSGSKSRNPLNVASVELIFDNSDHYLNIPYTEISIKRRIYRSGENEYYLNGEKCRLKDITNLLLDSGMGKESFNSV